MFAKFRITMDGHDPDTGEVKSYITDITAHKDDNNEEQPFSFTTQAIHAPTMETLEELADCVADISGFIYNALDAAGYDKDGKQRETDQYDEINDIIDNINDH